MMNIKPKLKSIYKVSYVRRLQQERKENKKANPGKLLSDVYKHKQFQNGTIVNYCIYQLENFNITAKEYAFYVLSDIHNSDENYIYEGLKLKNNKRLVQYGNRGNYVYFEFDQSEKLEDIEKIVKIIVERDYNDYIKSWPNSKTVLKLQELANIIK